MSSIDYSLNFNKDFLTVINIIAISLTIICFSKFFKIESPFSNAKFETFGTREFGIVNTDKRTQILDLFKQITSRCDRLVNHCLQTSYPDKERAIRLHERWNNVRIRETENDEDTIAYIVNKDYEMRVCVTDKKENKNLEDINTAMFVVIHELAHMTSETYGHNEEFWNNFKLLLKEAIKLGVYDYSDYSRNSEYYCGIKIYSTPCKDAQCDH
tara:strand:- start:729 stop:1367 length:639 start_codon:yes stop_codon:yes gene_type:complete